jgi:hypothetical protein
MSERSRESDRASRELARAAREISKAAQELRRTFRHRLEYQERYLDTVRDALSLSEEVVRRHGALLSSATELPEEEAAIIADQSVHRVRKVLALDMVNQPKAPPPTDEEIREWVQRREDRRKREAS